MYVMISADMEGVAGVVHGRHTGHTEPEWQRFRRVMTAEVNAAIEGALAGGATKIIVNDSHGTHTNIVIEDMNPAASLVSGLAAPYYMMQGIGPDVDVVLLLGYHGKSGSSPAVLDHSLSGTVISVFLNGVEVGEIGLNAAIAGTYGVPITMVTGDQTVALEARDLLGDDIETVVAKQALTRTSAECLHPSVVQKLIREAAERAVGLEVAPYIVEGPVTLRVCFHRSLMAQLVSMLPGSKQVDGRTVEWTGPDMREAYRAYQTMTGLSMLAEMAL